MNKGLYEAIREKAFEIGNESTVIKYENKGNNHHEIVITYDEEIEYEVSDVVLEYSNTEDKQTEKGAKDMKSFEGKLKELQDRAENKQIETIEWSQVNTERNDGKTTITTKFKYEIPTPIKNMGLKLEDEQND
ncbi:hypothetical protein OXR01_13060 [Staphylococcus gallinarum]|uniref:hypothetical protein n=1 Tax=Staphylococcus gallinarum TaxID=1293 RepID=UPI00227FCD93|nr:hypothetical protein [Staphylococcus gallinarum]MDN6414819.1 hypothetical protein [Staphylococcus gallinarum]